MTQIETLKQEMREVLENNILRFWIDRMQDEEHGGFYGRIDNGNVLHKDAEKGAILNARILWTFSAAYRVLRKPEYLDMATRAKDYIIARIRRSSSMPSALPSMAFRNMPEPQVTERPWNTHSTCMTA